MTPRFVESMLLAIRLLVAVIRWIACSQSADWRYMRVIIAGSVSCLWPVQDEPFVLVDQFSSHGA